ncbi:hypothetical protein D3C80_2125740 [compost metagenome]
MNGYTSRIGTEATTVMAARIDSGVTTALADSWFIPTPAATFGLLLEFIVEDNSFISSYCSVLRFCLEEV